MRLQRKLHWCMCAASPCGVSKQGQCWSSETLEKCTINCPVDSIILNHPMWLDLRHIRLSFLGWWAISDHEVPLSCNARVHHIDLNAFQGFQSVKVEVTKLTKFLYLVSSV